MLDSQWALKSVEICGLLGHAGLSLSRLWLMNILNISKEECGIKCKAMICVEEDETEVARREVLVR